MNMALSTAIILGIFKPLQTALFLRFWLTPLIPLSQMGMGTHTLVQLYFLSNIWVFAIKQSEVSQNFDLHCFISDIKHLFTWLTSHCILSSVIFLFQNISYPLLIHFFSLIYGIFINIDNLLYVKCMENILPRQELTY